MSTGVPFIEQIFSQLQAAADTRILAEVREGEITGVTGGELLELVGKARTFIASRGLKRGDRCGLLAANSIRWVATDLALMAEGLIVVPLYSRQAPAELVAMMKANPKVEIQLEGHTDNQGSADANLKLSQDRVDAVKKYLSSKGINKDRVKTKAFGGTQPLATEKTEEAQALNRRVEMRVLKD